MNKFQEITANAQSISQRSLIFGMARNDASYKIMIDIGGVRHICPIYNLWKVMIQRCYDPSALRKRPDYKDCYVCDEWMLFSNFYKWVKNQDYKYNQIDKDILKTGNKIYSPETCLFVPPEINKLLVKKSKTKGRWPQGVSRVKKSGRFISYCAVNGKNKGLGTFDTPEEAHQAYLEFKSIHVVNIAIKQTDPRLKGALIRISGEIARGEYYK